MKKVASFDEKKFIEFGQNNKTTASKIKEKVYSSEDQLVIFKEDAEQPMKPITEKKIDLDGLISVSAKKSDSSPVVDMDNSRIISNNIQNQLKQRRENRQLKNSVIIPSESKDPSLSLLNIAKSLYDM